VSVSDVDVGRLMSTGGRLARQRRPRRRDAQLQTGNDPLPPLSNRTCISTHRASRGGGPSHAVAPLRSQAERSYATGGFLAKPRPTSARALSRKVRVPCGRPCSRSPAPACKAIGLSTAERPMTVCFRPSPRRLSAAVQRSAPHMKPKPHDSSPPACLVSKPPTKVN
jgi:hypothetical protein